jgi:hypothetical protein
MTLFKAFGARSAPACGRDSLHLDVHTSITRQYRLAGDYDPHPTVMHRYISHSHSACANVTSQLHLNRGTSKCGVSLPVSTSQDRSAARENYGRAVLP